MYALPTTHGDPTQKNNCKDTAAYLYRSYIIHSYIIYIYRCNERYESFFSASTGRTATQQGRGKRRQQEAR